MTILDASARRSHAQGFLVPCLALGAWLFLILHVLALDAPSIVAQTGPGMEFFAIAMSALSGDPVSLLIGSGLCLTPGAPWTPGDFTQALTMWSAMVIAMMLPASFRSPASASLSTIAGYLIAWLPFCITGVLLQWLLRQAGYLDGFLVSASLGLNIAILALATGSICWGQIASRPAVARLNTSTGLWSGLRHGLLTVRGCGMIMTLMFVCGLMNLVAMTLLTGAMFFLTRNVSR